MYVYEFNTDVILCICQDGNGIIGLTPDTKKATVPTLIFPADCVRISSGSDHMAVVKSDGSLWTFGNAEQGQLGRVATW